MMNTFFPFGGIGMGLGIFIMILFWGLIIWLIVWLITQYAKPKRQKKPESALAILEKRYAKGEITNKQFRGMKTEILR